MSEKKYEELKEWDDSYMSIPSLRDHLLKKHKTTSKGKPVCIQYVHYLIEQGALPWNWGGYELDIRMFRGMKVVKITNIIREKKQRGRKLHPSNANKKKGGGKRLVI